MTIDSVQRLASGVLWSLLALLGIGLVVDMVAPHLVDRLARILAGIAICVAS